MIYITNDSSLVKQDGHTIILTENTILPYIEKHYITFLYITVNLISKKCQETLLKDHIGIVNVNFTPVYTTHPRILNFAISMTEYWKLKLIHTRLSSTYVTYNPIDFENWNHLSEKTKGNFREALKNKKFIIGRIARTEPSKWHFLILSTLFLLDKKKQYDFGFIFVGMPWLYKKMISLFCSRELQGCIIFLPELKEYPDIAEFYKSIDLFWQTSWIGESFGNVIAESFCFKVPVITDYKWFYKDGKVNESLYDTQIELVDHLKNGVYLDNPLSTVHFLESTTKEVLSKMGVMGYQKVKEEYDVKLTSKTIGKILYEYGKKNLDFNYDETLENLRQIPSLQDIESYQEQYRKRIDI